MELAGEAPAWAFDIACATERECPSDSAEIAGLQVQVYARLSARCADPRLNERTAAELQRAVDRVQRGALSTIASCFQALLADAPEYAIPLMAAFDRGLGMAPTTRQLHDLEFVLGLSAFWLRFPAWAQNKLVALADDARRARVLLHASSDLSPEGDR